MRECLLVVKPWIFSLFIVFITSFLPNGSNIAVASSNIIHLGFMAIIPAIATLCFWPKVKEGEFVAIIGHNGSGKSTLSKNLNAILFPTKGNILINKMA